MAIFYSENPAPFKGRFNMAEANATAYYLSHYSNYLILDAIILAPKSREEKRDATRELTVCEKKLAFWRDHRNFDAALAGREVAKLKAAWRRAA